MKTKEKRGTGFALWLLKIALIVFAALVGFTFIPGRFIPAGYTGDLYLKLVNIRNRSVCIASQRVRNVPAKADEETAELKPATATRSSSDDILICSFNIQFLGSSRSRDDLALASMLKDCQIVVVQELVAPPYPAFFPDGSPVKPDPESAEFFDAMKSLGFAYWLSEEDTGTGTSNHSNGSNTEWWVAFYKDEVVDKALDLPHGFLADDRTDHPDFERVPYAFAFRADNGGTDFVLISVHLKPGEGRTETARRKQELDAISAWIDASSEREKDFIILGDCNIEDAEELAAATPAGFLSLNDECIPTNTNVNGPKPYDHIFFRPEFTTEIDREFDMVLIDLVEAMRPFWQQDKPFPGDPYDHNDFRKWYSDHHPIAFLMKISEDDD